LIYIINTIKPTPFNIYTYKYIYIFISTFIEISLLAINITFLP
jgi:hypothetical protein